MQQFRRDEEVLTAAPAVIVTLILIFVVLVENMMTRRIRMMWMVWVTRAIILPARNTNHTFVHQSFVARIHSLVDLVDDAEGGFGQGLEGHEVEDCGDGAFAAGLAVRV